MDGCNSIKHDFHKTSNMYPNISNDQQFKLNKINEIKDYFIAEIFYCSKLNSIESKISEELINNEISHEDFMTILMKKRNIES